MTSIRRRLVVGLAVGVSAIWLCGAALSVASIGHELDEVFDESLRETARRLLSLVASDATPSEASVFAIDPMGAGETGEDDYREELLSYLVRDRDGEIVVLSRGANERDFQQNAPEGFSSSGDHRFYVERMSDEGLSIQVFDPLWHRRETVLEAALAIVAPLPILIALSIALGWLLVRHALGDIRRVSAELESRGGRNLAPLASDAAPVELRPVIESMNRMLARLSGALDAERGLASDAAHELRTPIATALAQTQRLVATLPSGPARDRGDTIATTLRELGRLAEKLVQLGRAESGFMDAGERRDSAHVIPHVLDEFHDHAGIGGGGDGDGRLRYRIVGDSRFASRLDPDGLAIVLRNLIENALKHGTGDTPVEVILDGAVNTLRIVNDTDFMLPATPDALRTRFARGRTDAAGAGLGLAIVDATLRGTGLTLDLRVPPLGRESGFEAVLRELETT